MKAVPPPYPPVSEMCAYIGPRGSEDMDLANSLVNLKGAILWEVPPAVRGAPWDVWACGMGYVPYGARQLIMRVHEVGVSVSGARRGRMGEVPSDQAARLLGLAQGALSYLDSVAKAGTGPGATLEQRAAATRSRACLDELAPLAAPFDAVVAELRAAVQEARPAKVTAAQAGALEAYATCADKFAAAPAAEAPTIGWLAAIVGIGLPTLAVGIVSMGR